MPSRNIEIFNRVVAITLVKLYEAFPDPIDMRGVDIGHEASEGLEAEEAEHFRLMMNTAENTIQFLAHEGFLRYSENSRYIGGPEFPETCLTLKGFSLLGKTPQAVDLEIERRPLIEQLHDVVEDGATATATQVVQSLFAGALKLGVSAVGFG